MKCVFFSLFFITLFVSSLPVNALEFSRVQVMMGNVPVSITIRAKVEDRTSAFFAMQQSYDRGRALEKIATEFSPASETSRLNRLAGRKWMAVSPDMMSMLEQARNFSERTSGAFDITFSSSDRSSRYTDVKLDKKNRRVFLGKKGTRIILSGIAKGYIIDEMSRVLDRAGFREHVVNAGGDLYAAGQWRVGIRDPRRGEKTSVRLIRVKDKGVSSSGNYERGAHIFDPATGQSVKGPWSTTAIADKAVESGALSVASFVLGAKGLSNISPQSSVVRIWILDYKGLHRYRLKGRKS